MSYPVFAVEIITPDSRSELTDATLLDVPAEDGRLTVLARHQPMVCSLSAGLLRIRTGEQIQEWLIGPGTLSVGGNRAELLLQKAAPAAPPRHD